MDANCLRVPSQMNWVLEGFRSKRLKPSMMIEHHWHETLTIQKKLHQQRGSEHRPAHHQHRVGAAVAAPGFQVGGAKAQQAQQTFPFVPSSL